MSSKYILICCGKMVVAAVGWWLGAPLNAGTFTIISASYYSTWIHNRCSLILPPAIVQPASNLWVLAVASDDDPVSHQAFLGLARTHQARATIIQTVTQSDWYHIEILILLSEPMFSFQYLSQLETLRRRHWCYSEPPQAAPCVVNVVCTS